MIRIRRIHDDVTSRDRAAVEAAQRILRKQLPGLPEATVAELPLHLRDPFRSGLRSLLFSAESERGEVKGFALLRHATDLDFCFLDFISAAPGTTGRGIGGALYERLREEARALGVRALLFESLPDDPDLCGDAAVMRQNAARLRFYERYGARPIVGTRYETPLSPDDECAPYLVYDPLGHEEPLRRGEARDMVRAILERRYGVMCPPAYVDMVVASFEDDPVRIREPRYGKSPTPPSAAGAPPRLPRARTAQEDRDAITLVVNEGHAIHHVRERGYVEAPVRISAILKEILPTGLFRRVPPLMQPESRITAVHEPAFVRYLQRICASVPPGESVYPYVFPIRNAARPPDDLTVRAGYYCIDTFTPLNANAWVAAKGAVDCALTAAEEVRRTGGLAYALVRPPGHHAEHSSFGGFCYFNSAAVAAHRLAARGRVAILDVDYHHGNGQQDIFWRRGDVLTVSLHGHPRFAYPYFSGFTDEEGEDAGEGANLNLALPESLDGAGYRKALGRALRAVADFDPHVLVVALGLDPAKGDPTGTWSLLSADVEANGRMLGELGLPTLVVQEGGYRTRSLGINARRFFVGLSEAWRKSRAAVGTAAAEGGGG
ncbi:MAG TPA: histone deacetylase family protein [Longimicrobiales bacterium]|nr:histone deacetylase family protein [Longimicrobiales bacterium]